MKEETGGTATDRIENWANNNSIYRPSAPAIEHEEPPYYDQSVRLQYRPTNFGHQGQHNQHYNQERHQPMVPMDAAWPPSGAGTYQTQGNIINTRESVEEQREKMRRKLVKRNIPAELWEYYLELPED